MKFKCYQKNGGHFIGDFSEKQKIAYENSPHTKGKYRFEEIKEVKKAPVPKQAEKVKSKKPVVE